MDMSQPAPEQIEWVNPADLVDSPLQPRTVYENIDSLAATITADGRIHQPLIARLVDHIGTGHRPELVFGHRRKRAALLLALPKVPVIFRAMSDAEVRAAQMSENIARDNMKSLEEAAGFQAQIEHDGLTRKQIAERIGKSESFVTGRLRLLTLCTEVADALKAGLIQSEVALLVARVGTEKMQQKALAYINSKYADLEDGGESSYRQIRDMLNEKFTLELGKAIFDTQDFHLLPEAGACTTCPKRSGLAPEFDDIVNPRTSPKRSQRGHLRHTGADVCTDPDCFDEKKKAHLVQEAKKLEAAGKTVVSGHKARAAVTATGEVKGAYIPLAEAKAAIKEAAKATPKPSGKQTALNPVPAKPEPKVVTIINPRDGKQIQAVAVADLQAAGVKVPEAKKAAASSWEVQERQRREQIAKAQVQANALTAHYTELLQQVHQAAATRARTGFELGLIAEYAVQHAGHFTQLALHQLYGVKSDAALLKLVKGMNADELGLLLLAIPMCANVQVNYYNLKDKPEALLAVASLYGISAKPQPPAKPEAPAKATAKPANKAKPGKPAVRYRDPATGSTWSGRGLQPAWLKAALASGRSLAEFDTTAPKPTAKAPAATSAPPPAEDHADEAVDEESEEAPA